MIWPFTRREPAPAPAPVAHASRVPPDVAARLDAATVSWRAGAEPGHMRAIVHVAGMGMFYWEGDGEDLIARIGRAFDLPEATAERAARMLAAVIAREEREMARARRAEGRQPSWVWDW